MSEKIIWSSHNMLDHFMNLDLETAKDELINDYGYKKDTMDFITDKKTLKPFLEDVELIDLDELEGKVLPTLGSNSPNGVLILGGNNEI